MMIQSTTTIATTQITSGVTLGWALASLSVGIAIVAIVLIRLWLDYRGRKSEQTTPGKHHNEHNASQDIDPNEAPQTETDPHSKNDDDQSSEDNVGEHPN